MSASLNAVIRKTLQATDSIPKVIIQGWVVKEHRKGKLSFLHVTDGSTNDTLQVVLPRKVCRNVGIGSAIEVIGEWKPSGGKQQAMELFAHECEVLTVDSGQPIHGTFENIRTKLHLRPKHSGFATLLRLRSQVNQLTHQFFTGNDYVYVDTPLISSNDCEGAGEAFEVNAPGDDDFFGDGKKFLTVSGQLHLEALTSGLPRVYTVGTAFRAERSLSRQHMAEFKMLEAERAFIRDLDDLCDEVESYVKYVATSLHDVRGDVEGLAEFVDSGAQKDALALSLTSSKRFPRLSFTEAVDLVQSKGEKVVGGALNKGQELLLAELCQSPVFIVEFPASSKPFYMKTEGDKALCFDLVAPLVGELAGGSLRETDADKMRSKQDITALNWYYELRQRGLPPTGGFGLGFDRFIQCLFGIPNIKDVAPFPRWYKHCQC
uniref:AA_TRNA_LIGASE_II domain-containing protein n=1 Tax=Panagrellus redivivus TaxID=6233 RepID=A0A7E4VH32_PANRE